MHLLLILTTLKHTHTHTHTHTVKSYLNPLKLCSLVYHCLIPRSSAVVGVPSKGKEAQKQHPDNQNALSKFALTFATELLTLVSSDHKGPQKPYLFPQLAYSISSA